MATRYSPANSPNCICPTKEPPAKGSVNAFIETFELPVSSDGPLSNLTSCAKDIDDVASHQTRRQDLEKTLAPGSSFSWFIRASSWMRDIRVR